MKKLIAGLLIGLSGLSTGSLIGMCNACDDINSYDGVRVEFLGQSNQNYDSEKIAYFCCYLSALKDEPLPEILRNLLADSLNLPEEVKFVCNLSDENITISYLKDIVCCCQNGQFCTEECAFSVVLSGELGLMSVKFGDRVFPEEFGIDESVFCEKTFKFTLNCWVDQSKGEKYLEIYRTKI